MICLFKSGSVIFILLGRLVGSCYQYCSSLETMRSPQQNNTRVNAEQPSKQESNSSLTFLLKRHR